MGKLLYSIVALCCFNATGFAQQNYVHTYSAIANLKTATTDYTSSKAVSTTQ